MSTVAAFLSVALLLVAAGLAWLLWPLLRHRPPLSAIDQSAINLRILKSQLADLEAEREAGSVTPALYAESRSELERRVLEETQAAAAPATAAPAASGTPRLTAAAIALLLPVGGFGLYALLADPNALNPPPAQSATADGGAHSFSPEQIDQMLVQLEQRLEKQPDDARGWSILARTYYSMQRYPESVRAFERLAALEANNADVLADYADAMAVMNNRQLAGKPMEIVLRALAADPDHWKALALAGTDAFERKDYRTAVAYWERITRVAGGSPIAEQIGGSIAEARRLGSLGDAPVDVKDLPGVGARPVAVATGPLAPGGGSAPQSAAGAAPKAAAAPAEGTAAGAGTPAEPAGAATARITGRVSLDPRLAAKAAADDTVFVFARNAEGARMPLALLRLRVKDLPAEFSLDDSQALSPAFKLSTAGEVVVGARVSKAGQAMPNSGDLEGTSSRLKVGAKDVAITIDSVLP